ncbi:MAG: hypothetical protein IPO03_00760 [Bacteroidetes bacterium]|nr:hypothetical protein [Bacteroidota bacterium]
MHENDYYKALFEQIGTALDKELNEKKEFQYKNNKIKIKSIRSIGIDKIKNEIKLHKLFSGQPNLIFIEGSIRIEQIEEKLTKTRDYKFWIQELTFKFNQNTEKFEILKIAKFIIL